ncbi:hypothetical protein J7I01_004629, partial [Vibrio parahaemolyticus]|nr:hypothetical protein [Vibrio parahaemolyticus]
VTNDPAISWSSSDGAIATISSGQVSGNGVATGVSVGSVTITAQGVANSTPFSATATLNVTDAVVSSLQVTPATASTPVGLTKAFTATAILSDGVTTIDVTTDPAISWTSSNTAVATVDASGIATGVSMGTTTITASGTTPEGTPLSATATLTVTDAIIRSLIVTPATESTPIGLSKPFTATAILSDGVTTIDVTADPAISWTSSDTSIATISTSGANKGEATGEDLGTVTITAAGTTPEGTPLTGTAQLTVTAAVATGLQVTPPTETTPVGLTKGFTASLMMSDGTTPDVTEQVAWVSSDTAIATIVSGAPSGNGVATGEALGEATITATHTSGESSTATLTVTSKVVTALAVTPPTETTPAGLTKPFTATATYSDASTDDVTNSVSWTSSDTGIATIESNGIATGVNPGSVTITASDATSGETATASLDVTAAVVSSIDVTPANVEVPAGLTQAFTAMATLSNGDMQDITEDPATSWTSSAPSVATVSSSGSDKGTATGVTPGGPATITAANNGVNGSALLTVTTAKLESITVEPNPITVGVAKTGNLTATGHYSDGSSSNITSLVGWTGQDTSIATVASGGLVTGVALGSTSTTATLDEGYGTPVSSLPATINVEKSLVSISLTPTNVQLIATETDQFTAMATYDDGSNEDVTDQVSWVIADTSVASVTEGASGGLVSAAGDGITTVTAQLLGINSNEAAIVACTSLGGPCVVTTNIGDKIWSMPPSVAASEFYGWVPPAELSNKMPCLDTRNGVLVPGCEIYSPDAVYQDYPKAVASNTDLCDSYSAKEFKGRTNWRITDVDDVFEIEGENRPSVGTIVPYTTKYPATNAYVVNADSPANATSWIAGSEGDVNMTFAAGTWGDLWTDPNYMSLEAGLRVIFVCVSDAP